MSLPRFLTGLLLAAAGAAAPAGFAVAAPAPWTGTARVQFQATSTLKDFSGTAPVGPFTLWVDEHPDGLHGGGTATVAVAAMDTQHAKRDANMRRMFDSSRFPRITGVIPLTPLDPPPPDGIPLRLTIRDRTREVPTRLSNWTVKPDAVEFDLEFTVSLKAFDLSPPVFMGLLRVGDAVEVQVRIQLSQPP